MAAEGAEASRGSPRLRLAADTSRARVHTHTPAPNPYTVRCEAPADDDANGTDEWSRCSELKHMNARQIGTTGACLMMPGCCHRLYQVMSEKIKARNTNGGKQFY